MNAYQTGRAFGILTGIIIGLVLVAVLLRYMNTDHKMKTQYDEMQQIIRNRGYKYGFITVLIVEALLCVVTTAFTIPAEPIVIHFLPIFLGVVVQSSYSIWNGAEVGLNTNMKRYIVFAVIASLINFLAFFMAWRTGSLVEDGTLQAPFINLLCALMFGILGVVGLVRKAAKPEEEA
ncbi:MAG: hypothetical protein K6F56_01435 [Oscillospiraceae bacterium]|nr:hypothetical protein [Oscillospiraceae bacterium]